MSVGIPVGHICGTDELGSRLCVPLGLVVMGNAAPQDEMVALGMAAEKEPCKRRTRRGKRAVNRAKRTRRITL